MRYALLLLAACGPSMTLDPDGGPDSGRETPVLLTVSWGGVGCGACSASVLLSPQEAVAARASFSSTLNGFMCAIDESDAGVLVNCASRCVLPSKTDAGMPGCDWTPCLDGPLVCR